MNCDRLFLMTFVDMQKLLTPCSTKTAVTVVAVVFVLGISFINFEKWYVITMMYSLPLILLGRGPRMSITMSTGGFSPEVNVVFAAVSLFSGYARMIHSS